MLHLLASLLEFIQNRLPCMSFTTSATASSTTSLEPLIVALCQTFAVAAALISFRSSILWDI